MLEQVFIPWPKISRWNRDITITEKLDGTSCAVGITKDGQVYAQSRNRIIPSDGDHFGFAAWVEANKVALRDLLGEGVHHGEQWGSGIGRGYGKAKGEKTFSLFNTSRWNPENTSMVPNLTSVPVLYEGMMSELSIDTSLAALRHIGSVAAPGYMRPEGIVIFHTAANSLFKITLEHDESPKSLRAA